MSDDSRCYQLLLVGGGARSGKSAHAIERAVALGKRRVFVATAQTRDSEMEERVARHREERGDLFQTLEVPLDLPEAITAGPPCDVLLVDCLTLWISNLMEQPTLDVRQRIEDLVAALHRRPCHVVLVSNEVGMGIVPMHATARSFRDHVGWAHQRLARIADEVVLAALGCVLRLKPSPRLLSPPVQSGDGV